jgi:hypothetical protein
MPGVQRGSFDWLPHRYLSSNGSGLTYRWLHARM